MAFVIAAHVPIAGTAFTPVLLGWPLVLLPAHIVFIESIIDPICSVAFEAEPEEQDVMSRPPRSSEAHLFSWMTWLISLLQGAGVLVAVMVALILARVRGLGEGELRALAFTMLVVGNLTLVLSNPSWSGHLVATLRQPNPALGALLAVAVGVLGLTLYVPFLSRLFHFEALRGLDYEVVAVGGALCLLWCESLKALRSRVIPRGQ